MAEHDHEHDHDGGDEAFGIALGFRILEEAGSLFLVEAEIAPYVDAPEELGVTLVFHPLDGVNPVDVSDEVDWPSWPLDIDDDLSRNDEEPMEAQFRSNVKQLHDLSPEQLKAYMAQAREEADAS